MTSTIELRQKRAALVVQARELITKAETEKRELTAEEEQQYNSIMVDVDKLGKQINREETLQGIEGEIRTLTKSTERADETKAKPADEYRKAFMNYVRTNSLSNDELRALSVGVNVAGGFLVPDDFERRIVEVLLEQGAMRAVSTVVQTTMDRNIPVETSKGTAFWITEETSFIAAESDPAFGQRQLTSHKVATMIRISEELLQDNAFDLESYVINQFATRIGVREEEAFVAGTGVGQPRGITLDAPTGVTAAGAAVLTADEMIRLFHSLPVPYRNRATWLLNDTTILAVRRLTETTGQFIWQPGMQAGTPDRLYGRPVVTSPSMPTMGAGRVSVIIGDLSNYWIADRRGRVFQRLVELYAMTGQVGFRAYQRVDGLLVQTDAVRRLIHP